MSDGRYDTGVIGFINKNAGAFLILPLCIVFGRRPILLGCCLLLVGSTIGAATSRSFQEHMACRILQGIATGATESVSRPTWKQVQQIDRG